MHAALHQHDHGETKRTRAARPGFRVAGPERKEEDDANEESLTGPIDLAVVSGRVRSAKKRCDQQAPEAWRNNGAVRMEFERSQPTQGNDGIGRSLDPSTEEMAGKKDTAAPTETGAATNGMDGGSNVNHQMRVQSHLNIVVKDDIEGTGTEEPGSESARGHTEKAKADLDWPVSCSAMRPGEDDSGADYPHAGRNNGCAETGGGRTDGGTDGLVHLESRAVVDKPECESKSVRQIRAYRNAGYAHVRRDNGNAVSEGVVADINASGHARAKSWADVHRLELQVDAQPVNGSGQERQEGQTGNEAAHQINLRLNAGMAQHKKARAEVLQASSADQGRGPSVAGKCRGAPGKAQRTAWWYVRWRVRWRVRWKGPTGGRSTGGYRAWGRKLGQGRGLAAGLHKGSLPMLHRSQDGLGSSAHPGTHHREWAKHSVGTAGLRGRQSAGPFRDPAGMGKYQGCRRILRRQPARIFRVAGAIYAKQKNWVLATRDDEGEDHLLLVEHLAPELIQRLVSKHREYLQQWKQVSHTEGHAL